jgi:hypothetical protein
MSIRAYAAARHADPKSIRRGIADGIVVRDANGQIDPEQADRAWASARRASRLGQHQHDDAGTRSAKAKIAVTLAKLRLIKQRLDIMRERYVDRAQAVDVGEREAVYVVESLQASPMAYSPKLAAEMGIPDEMARRILRRFVDLMLVEIGDLPGQAKRDAERA